MPDKDKYIEGESTSFKSNKGVKYTFTVYYAKETPKGFWKSVYKALEYFGSF